MTEARWQVAGTPAPTTPSDRHPSTQIWFTLNDIDFPGVGWYDLPLSVLGSAVAAYIELRNGEPEAWSYFFEGPYYLGYRRAGDAKPAVYIEANCDRDPDAIVSIATGTLPLAKLHIALLHAAQALHAEISEKNYHPKSVQTAADLLAKLDGCH